MAARRLLPLLLLAFLPLPATAHGVFEASELEVHLLNDEGSDVIESYGGYDIQDLFVGFAHDPLVGAGAAGDGLYVRLYLYGLMANSPPLPGQTWTVSVTFGTPNGPLTRTLSTLDGVTLTSDFDALLYEVADAERTTHVQRAFISYERAGLAPGQAVGPFVVESRVNGDLRDAAPGGIPVPGTNGASEYPEPTAIEGRGTLVESVVLAAPDRYVAVAAVPAATPNAFDITVTSTLGDGAQHVFVTPIATEGWTYELQGTTSAPLEANGTLAFTLVAQAGNATGPLRLEVQTDIGGRSELWVAPNGTLFGPGGLAVAPAAAPPQESPGVWPLAPVLAVLALVALRRRV